MRKTIISLCRQDVGITENPKGTNRVKYSEWYGLIGAWCGMAVSYIYYFASIATGDIFPLEGIDSDNGFCSVPNFKKWADKNGYETLDPQEGDIVIYDFDGNGTWDHVGIFNRWENSNKFTDYEGNTSSDNKGSQSNGGGFYLKTRNYNKLRVKFYSVIK